MAKLETLFEHAVDYHFDKFEVYCLSNVFCARDQTRVNLESVTEKSSKCRDLKAKIIAVKYYLHRCKSEIKRQEERIKVLDGISDVCLRVDGLVDGVVKLRRDAESVKGANVDCIAEVEERFVVPGKGEGFIGFAGDFAAASRIGEIHFGKRSEFSV